MTQFRIMGKISVIIIIRSALQQQLQLMMKGPCCSRIQRNSGNREFRDVGRWDTTDETTDGIFNSNIEAKQAQSWTHKLRHRHR
jgi:hypothetical protein